MDLLKYLQGWIGMVGLIALGNTISCFRGHEFLADKLYTGQPDLVNPLVARMFGVWTFLSALLRIQCSLDFRNKGLYKLTFMSFVLALLHFLSEAFIYKTAPVTTGVLAPLIISSLSAVFMLVGWFYLDAKPDGPEHTKPSDLRRQKLLYSNKLS